MADTILFLRAIHPDGTVDKREVRIGMEESCEVRIRFHRGRIANAATLRPIRMPSAGSLSSGLNPAAAAGPSAEGYLDPNSKEA
jgi:hypothetical protein